MFPTNYKKHLKTELNVYSTLYHNRVRWSKINLKAILCTRYAICSCRVSTNDIAKKPKQVKITRI